MRLILLLACCGALLGQASRVIKPGDQLYVYFRMLGSTTPKVVRDDGRIVADILGEIMAAGLTTEQLRAAIAMKLDARRPSGESVTVTFGEPECLCYFVHGMFNRPGRYPLTEPIKVLAALSKAGGFVDFAPQRIFIIRFENGESLTLPYNYRAVIQRKQEDIEVKSGDIIVR
jgi:protein involved in polysaccharide export with SLBB domain